MPGDAASLLVVEDRPLEQELLPQVSPAGPRQWQVVFRLGVLEMVTELVVTVPLRAMVGRGEVVGIWRVYEVAPLEAVRLELGPVESFVAASVGDESVGAPGSVGARPRRTRGVARRARRGAPGER